MPPEAYFLGATDDRLPDDRVPDDAQDSFFEPGRLPRLQFAGQEPQSGWCDYGFRVSEPIDVSSRVSPVGEEVSVPENRGLKRRLSTQAYFLSRFRPFSRRDNVYASEKLASADSKSCRLVWLSKLGHSSMIRRI